MRLNVQMVRSDLERFRAGLNKFERTQLPFATALAINTTARAAVDSMTRELPEIFRKKGAITPFTRRAIGWSPAKAKNLRAAVFVKRKQAEYLKIEETGGSVARAPGAPILTPVHARLNVYGNLPQGVIRRAVEAAPLYFLGSVRGVYGLWERLDRTGVSGGSTGPRGGIYTHRGALRLIAAFRGRASYRPKFGFQEHMAASVRANFLPALRAGMARALETAFR
jgi:hypothetical protein